MQVMEMKVSRIENGLLVETASCGVERTWHFADVDALNEGLPRLVVAAFVTNEDFRRRAGIGGGDGVGREAEAGRAGSGA
jgi:hypothetical protein